MVARREELEKIRHKLNRRWRIFWIIIAGLLVLLVLFFSLQRADLILGVYQHASSSPLTANDWPMFHRDLEHSGNAGTEGKLPQGILAWTFTTGGKIHSSPAVSNGIVYFGSQDYYIYAVDAATGRQIWAFKTRSFVESSPVVSGGVVYCGSNDGTLYALNAMTGEKIWTFSVKYSLQGSPAIADDVVYIGSDDYSFYAVDAASGKLKWKKQTGSLVQASPVVSDGIVIIGSADGICYTYDAKSGRVRLQYDNKSPVRTSAAVKDGTAYIVSNGDLVALKIKAKNWIGENKLRFYWNALYVYGVAPKPSNPSGLLWRQSVGFGLTTGSSVAISDSHAYFGVGDNVTSFDITARQIQWSFDAADKVVSSPAVTSAAIYFGGGNGQVYALDRATGALLWENITGGKITSSPSVADGMLYITSEDGNLYAYK